MSNVPSTTVKDGLSSHEKKSALDERLVARHRKLDAILVGFADENDRLNHSLEHDEFLLKRMPTPGTRCAVQPAPSWPNPRTQQQRDIGPFPTSLVSTKPVVLLLRCCLHLVVSA